MSFVTEVIELLKDKNPQPVRLEAKILMDKIANIEMQYLELANN